MRKFERAPLAPVMPGSRRFPMREPEPGSRWGSYLQAIGFDLGESPADARQALVEAFTASDAVETREAFLANGAEDVDGFFAPHIKAAVAHRSVLFAAGLDELDRQSAAKTPGAPGNSAMYQVVAFWTWQEERRLVEEAGGEYRRADLAQILGLHPDVLSRAVVEGGRAALTLIRASMPPNATDLSAAGWAGACHFRTQVREVWPEFRERFKSRR
jgi:hypothetical protein